MSKKNTGQFKKSNPRFEEAGWYRTKVHVLDYNRELRMWSPACAEPGEFPAGTWIAQGGEQPEVTCSNCKKVVWT